MSKSKRRGGIHELKQPAQSPEIATAIQQALAFYQEGQLARAEALFRSVAKQAPNHFDAHHFLGLIEYRRGNYEAAVRLIDQALKLDPNSAVAHSNMGAALLALKRHEEALANYDRALAITPDLPQA